VALAGTRSHGGSTGSRIFVSAVVGVLTASMAAVPFVTIGGYEDCTFFEVMDRTCPRRSSVYVVGAVIFLVAAAFVTWATWRATRQRSALGEMSLIAAVASPWFLFIPAFASAAGGDADRFSASILILPCLAATTLAIAAGWVSGRGAAAPLTGRIGRALGWIEVALVVLLALLLWVLQDDLNQRL
jgi:hypothetical protein